MAFVADAAARHSNNAWIVLELKPSEDGIVEIEIGNGIKEARQSRGRMDVAAHRPADRAGGQQGHCKLRDHIGGPARAECAPCSGHQHAHTGQLGFVKVAVHHVTARDRTAQRDVQAGVVPERPGDQPEPGDRGKHNEQGGGDDALCPPRRPGDRRFGETAQVDGGHAVRAGNRRGSISIGEIRADHQAEREMRHEGTKNTKEDTKGEFALEAS